MKCSLPGFFFSPLTFIASEIFRKRRAEVVGDFRTNALQMAFDCSLCGCVQRVSQKVCLWDSFKGVCKISKRFIMPVCLSAWNTHHWTDCREILYFRIY
jgi:hypothetical protein